MSSPTYDAMLEAIDQLENLPPQPVRLEMSGLTLAWLKGRYASQESHAFSGLYGIPVVKDDTLPFGKIEIIEKDDE